MEPSTWLMSDPTIILAPEEYELRPRCAIAYSRPVSGALAVSKLPYRDSQRDLEHLGKVQKKYLAQSYLQDLERIQDASATEPEASTTSGSESTDVSDSGQDSGNDSSHPSTSVLKKQPSTPAEEAVQEKWLSLARRSSFTAPTTSPVPILPPRTNEPELGRGRTCIRAPGPVAPLSFTSYAPRPSTPKGAEGHNDTPQKEDDPQPASSGMKRKRRRYPKWIGKSTTPIPPPILPPSSIQKMQRGDNGAVPEPSTPSSPIQPTGLEK
ncbi:hypothetical protein PG991_004484 [Apiospora marii]|uniref:Uncharacterized protein n=1 Tax=Apiospora marii TaxID=335849 RepID=A0ABR1S6G0_9PEZI